ncbi:MAG TPA: YsnF/AvaK domain-containing protein, partial [Ktedonobacterales bacterium]|nr:YsnF/AvaK domain-containing protein [Ktedonobacterales bacterium]
DVTQEQQTVQAPVTHEEVSVERRLGSDRALADDAFTDKDIDIPVMGGQLNVAKEAHVAEEVHLRKDRVTEQQQVTDTVRRERLRVEGDPGGADVFNEADAPEYGATDTTNARDNDNLLP